MDSGHCQLVIFGGHDTRHHRLYSTAMEMEKDTQNCLQCPRTEVTYLQAHYSKSGRHLKSHTCKRSEGGNESTPLDHGVNSFSSKYGCSVVLALAGLLVHVPLLPGCNQFLSSPVDYMYLISSLNLLEDLKTFNLRQYLLGSPLALSTMMEMRCGPVCYSTKRVYNLTDLQPGDHIRHVGSIYSHHSLIDHVLNESAVFVVHYNDNRPKARKVSGCFPYFDKAIVLEETLLLNSTVDLIELIVYDDEHQIEPNEDRLKEARSRLGYTNYGLLTNNCEAFLHEICVGLRYSRQAEFVADMMHMVVFVPYLALIHLCRRWFGETGNGSKNDILISEIDECPIILNLDATASGDDSRNKFSSVNDTNQFYSFFLSNICVSVMLFLLYVLYRTCMFILTMLGVLWYRIYFPD